MPRIDPELRRQAITRTALALFQRDGFDSVRVDDILKAIGLSKGGFYHHFKSREDILRQIVVDETNGIAQRLNDSLLDDDPISAITRLFLEGSTNLGAEVGVLGSLGSFAARSVYLDELERQLALQLKPYIVQVIEKGIFEEVFNVVDSSATAEIVLAVNDHGNRCAVLGNLNSQQLRAYNRTAIEALGKYLGIESQLGDLLTTLGNSQ